MNFVRPLATGHRRRFPLILTAIAGLLAVACSREPPPRPHVEIIKDDFKEILELNSQACDSIENFEKISGLEYRVTCANGENYRIHVSHEGRVNVTPHDP